MTTLVVAGISARMMAEAAAQAGYRAVALDVFGDRDTRLASAEWAPIGRKGGWALDADRTLQALRVVAAQADVAGWVAGSGFEAEPVLLEQGAGMLRLIGTPPAAVRRVRDPHSFFDFLDAAAIGHPQVSMTPPRDSRGWLAKSARGTGGWHIRRADAQPGAEPDSHDYFQRHVAGQPMSATFIASGSKVCVLGFNELIVRPFGTRPFVYCGAIGPVPLHAGVVAEVSRALRLLAAEFSICGLGSLDFMLDGETVSLLELNPRPGASMALYAHHLPHGVMAAHVRACLGAELPSLAVAPAPALVRGTEIVFARRPLALDERAAASLARWPHGHDLPWAAATFDAGDPVCSVSAEGATAGHVRTRLTERREALLNTLETWT